jgi:hypothetical protein
LIRDLVDGQYRKPVRIAAFNTTEGWSRDVTVDIADELRQRYLEFGEIPNSILDFIEARTGVEPLPPPQCGIWVTGLCPDQPAASNPSGLRLLPSRAHASGAALARPMNSADHWI